MVGPQQIPFGEVALLSFAKNTPFSTLIISMSVLLFLELRLAFVFHLDLCSDLVISFHQGVFLPLDLIGFHQKSWL
jgi:hypothetical protein